MRLRWLIAGSGLAAVAALWTWTAPGRPDLADLQGPRVPVQLLNNGFHTDLVAPRQVFERRAGPLADAVRGLAPGDWVVIGWGDAKFYVETSPIADRLPDGARAFFRPGNASVVMLDPAQTDPGPEYAPSQRRTLQLSPAAFDAMADRIEDSLALTDGRARVVARRSGDDARFFASRETFWIGYLCNNWTARALNAGGLAVRPMRSVTAGEVMAAAEKSRRKTDGEVQRTADRDRPGSGPGGLPAA